jgi:hypothetical protein
MWDVTGKAEPTLTLRVRKKATSAVLILEAMFAFNIDIHALSCVNIYSAVTIRIKYPERLVRSAAQSESSLFAKCDIKLCRG